LKDIVNVRKLSDINKYIIFVLEKMKDQIYVFMNRDIEYDFHE